MASIKDVVPRLKSADLKRTIRYYAKTLGLKTAVLWPRRKPIFCILDRGGVRIAFIQGGPPSSSTELSFEVEDAAGWHRKLKRKVEIEWGPEVYSYGRREFAFRDPDGHMIILSEPTKDTPTCRV